MPVLRSSLSGTDPGLSEVTGPREIAAATEEPEGQWRQPLPLSPPRVSSSVEDSEAQA